MSAVITPLFRLVEASVDPLTIPPPPVDRRDLHTPGQGRPQLDRRPDRERQDRQAVRSSASARTVGLMADATYPNLSPKAAIACAMRLCGLSPEEAEDIADDVALALETVGWMVLPQRPLAVVR
jgi:hypothetical protein